MLARTTKPPAPPTLSERIRHAADAVRAVDAQVKDTIECYLDSEKATQAGAGLPRESHRQMLMSRYREPWYAVLALESQLDEERAHE
jgi:hypothetical protein